MRKLLIIAALLSCTVVTCFAKSETVKEVTNYVELSSADSGAAPTTSFSSRTGSRKFSCELSWFPDGRTFLTVHARKDGWFGWYSQTTRYNFAIGDGPVASLGEHSSGSKIFIGDFPNKTDFEVWNRGVGRSHSGIVSKPFTPYF